MDRPPYNIIFAWIPPETISVMYLRPSLDRLYLISPSKIGRLPSFFKYLNIQLETVWIISRTWTISRGSSQEDPGSWVLWQGLAYFMWILGATWKPFPQNIFGSFLGHLLGNFVGTFFVPSRDLFCALESSLGSFLGHKKDPYHRGLIEERRNA